MKVRKPRRCEHPILCSFCGKRAQEVAAMVAGPNVFVCNECIELAVHALPQDIRDKITTGPANPFDQYLVPGAAK